MSEGDEHPLRHPELGLRDVGAQLGANLLQALPATGVGGGGAVIEETLEGIPDPYIAPIVFVTNPGGSWFAASGF